MTCEILSFVWAADGTAEIVWTNYLRGAIAAVAFVLLCILVYNHIVKGLKPNPGNVGNFVAFNATIAIGGGAALVVGLSEHWPALLLVAGACLGGGFLFGILFGYPLSPPPKAVPAPPNGTVPQPSGTQGGAPVDVKVQPGVDVQAQPPVEVKVQPVDAQQQVPAPQPGAGQTRVPPAGNTSPAGGQTQGSSVVVSATTPSGQTLLKQAADGLSKVVAGASLVSIQPLYQQFLYVSKDVTQLALPGSAADNYTCGAALISYFLILGFLAGLLLPPFYHLVESPSPDTTSPGGDSTQSKK